MLTLYRSMLDTYTIANKDDSLRTNPSFQDTFQDMINQTIECAIFIKGYTTEGYFSERCVLFRVLLCNAQGRRDR